MSSKKKPVSLAEKIGNLVTAAPTAFGSDDESEETKAKIVEFDDEIDDDVDNFQLANLSLRKRNSNLLEETDERYKGKKVSKKQILNQDDSSEESEVEYGDSMEDSDEESENISGDEKDDAESDNDKIEESDVDSEEGSEESNDNDELESKASDDNDESLSENSDDQNNTKNDEDDSNDDFDESVDVSNPLRKNRGSDGIKTMSETNIRAEIEKGNCVKEQLRLWENFLEMRIKLQKCLITSNKMPQFDVYKNYECDNEYEKLSEDVRKKVSGVLSNLLQLQSNLLNNFPETKDILLKNKKRKAGELDDESKVDDGMDEEIPSDTDDEVNGKEDESDNSQEELENSNEETKEPAKKKMKLSDFENIIDKNHKIYTEYRNSVIQKWNDKTRIASGITKKGMNQPAVKQIEFALANKEKLFKKTQLRRSEYEIIGKVSTSTEDKDGRRVQEYDSEIFDDDDFYHQLLRELIEYKSADITDPIQLSKQWIQLQNMRSKMKRKIDTRATKGRRIRYNVHKKLVNLMAPITVDDTWTDHAKNELYSSLFGKLKSNKETVPQT